jgi:hypothetical protein
LFSISVYPFNSIAKEIFLGRYISGTTFFRTEIYRGRLFLGAKQEDLTIVHFLNKLIVSCKEAVRVPFYLGGGVFLNWIVIVYSNYPVIGYFR